MRPCDHIVLEIKYEEVVPNRVAINDLDNTVFNGTYSTKQFSWLVVCPNKEIGIAAWNNIYKATSAKIIDVIESKPLNSIITAM